jgi:hypothetical protein
MAETTKAPQRERDEPERKITVTNMYRDQPILFHVVGGSVRLGPFETREVDAACLASPEVSDLVRAGVLLVREDEEQDAESSDEQASRQSPAGRQARSAGRRKAPGG